MANVKANEIKKEDRKVVEVRKELKNMLVVTYKFYMNKERKEKRIALNNAISNITLKTNRNGDLYAPVTNEMVSEIKENFTNFCSDCVMEVINTISEITFKQCVSKAYIDAFTQRFNKDANLEDCVRYYEFIKMLSYNVWQEAKKVARSK